MTDREEFEKVIDSIKLNDEMKKIIDELKANNFAMSAMVCKHPDKRTLDENYDTIKDYCDMLKADNPDVDCPECHNHENPEMICTFCMEKGTVSTVKALQYEIEQLKATIAELKDDIEILTDTGGQNEHYK